VLYGTRERKYKRIPSFTGMRIITGKWIKNGDYAVLTISNPISNKIGSDFGNIL